MRRSLAALAGLCLLAGCSAVQDGLEWAGVPADKAVKISADAVRAGQLFCQFDGQIAAVAGVNVVGASAAAVALACSVIKVAGQAPAATPVPVAAPPGAHVVLATVPPAVVDAVNASRTP